MQYKLVLCSCSTFFGNVAFLCQDFPPIGTLIHTRLSTAMFSFLPYLSGLELYSLSYSAVNCLSVIVNVLGESLPPTHYNKKYSWSRRPIEYIKRSLLLQSQNFSLKYLIQKQAENYHIQSGKLKAWLLSNSSLFGDHLPFF